MKDWLNPKAFWIAFCLMGIVQTTKLMNTDFSAIDLAAAFFACVIGGIFWGTIATLIYRAFNKK